MKKITVTEKTLKLNVNGQLQVYTEGDSVSVEDQIADICIKHGWADDTDGDMETGPRIPGASGDTPLQIDPIVSEIS